MREHWTLPNWRIFGRREPEVAASTTSAAIPPTLDGAAPPTPAQPNPPLDVDPTDPRRPDAGLPPNVIDPVVPTDALRRRRRNRAILAGTAAVLVVVAGLGGIRVSQGPDGARPSPSHSGPVAPGSDDKDRDLPPVPPTQPGDPPEASHTTTHPVRKGQSQWKIAAETVRKAIGREPTIGETNVVAGVIAADNIATHPDPGKIRPGDLLEVPDTTATNLIIRGIPPAAKTDPDPVVRQIHPHATALNNLPPMSKADVVKTQQPHLTQIAKAVKLELPPAPVAMNNVKTEKTHVKYVGRAQVPTSIDAAPTKFVGKAEVTRFVGRAKVPTRFVGRASVPAFSFQEAAPSTSIPFESTQAVSLVKKVSREEVVVPPVETKTVFDQSPGTLPAQSAPLPPSPWFQSATESPTLLTPADTTRQLLQKNFSEQPDIRDNKNVQDGVEVLVAVTKQTQQELPDDLVRFVSQRLHHSSTHATPTEQYFLDHLLTTLQIKPPHMKFAEWDEMRKKTVAVWTNAFSALQQQKSSPGLSHATLTAA